MNLLANAKVVVPDGVVPGTVHVEDGRVASISEVDEQDVTGWIVPGFVDIHCHGGDGASYTVGDAAQARKVAAFHLRNGTTTTLASLVSSPFELMLDAVHNFRPLVEEGVLAGIHFEGPYLAESRCGAQNPEALRDPDIRELDKLVEAGAGTVRMMTIAPERPGAMEAIEWLSVHGVLASIGHTDASYEVTLEGINAGATVATHLFNGMRPFNHRDPGPIPALIDDPRVTCELIADPVHLHMGTLAFAAHASVAQWAVLVTDAMSATGMPDGEYELGGLNVTVAEGAARLTDSGSIAGSTITMDDAFRNAVKLAGLEVPVASQMASQTPAELLGLDDAGRLEPGSRADLLVYNEDLELQAVMRAGEWIPR
ncbi:N-acetylglucosamine-6-phosphate deacetylase [Stackebrandtia nassauensis]|uniref:N-acetylglucosamine-6-phosphate deacetylase n=1 Tax=Stackebrandtia nassauensis (strain DSM 44728 / CIP 108903 / NRRL B-16338 / NBRC 102104 / LLR-40K-21) TaxID=446470 RepID=D3Q2T0_STANL|nr:N-acetylglucosamine-6-phosphate deacetylase [Stackebrandtia nassauensis]ADD45831.1 N-acetylglucosamine-6-phosphate deacetylase [Stackebrandtia nassauensis DSM 44728]